MEKEGRSNTRQAHTKTTSQILSLAGDVYFFLLFLFPLLFFFPVVVVPSRYARAKKETLGPEKIKEKSCSFSIYIFSGQGTFEFKLFPK